MVETGGKTIVVDTGPDFRQQMLREDIRRVDAVLFTRFEDVHEAFRDDRLKAVAIVGYDLNADPSGATLATLLVRLALLVVRDHAA